MLRLWTHSVKKKRYRLLLKQGIKDLNKMVHLLRANAYISGNVNHHLLRIVVCSS